MATGGSGSNSSSTVQSLPPPRPKSPPDLYGRRKEMLRVQVLEREKSFLEEELKFVERLQPASRCCKEMVDFVTANADPLLPTKNRKIGKSCYLWKWLCGSSCFKFSWACCCVGACTNCTFHLKAPKCCSCKLPDCSSCISCLTPKCSCWCNPCSCCCPSNSCCGSCPSCVSCPSCGSCPSCCGCCPSFKECCCTFKPQGCFDCCSCECKCTCPKCPTCSGLCNCSCACPKCPSCSKMCKSCFSCITDCCCCCKNCCICC